MNNKPKTEFVVYGGSFNPPTMAHYKIVSDFLHTKRFAPCKLFIEPVGEHAYGKNLLPLPIRTEMARIAFEPLQRYGALVTNLGSTLKMDNNKSTYSYLTALKTFLGKEFSVGLLVGGDQAAEIESKWINGVELLREFNIYITPRGDEDVNALYKWAMVRNSCYQNSNVTVLDPIYEGYRDVSSTRIRGLLASWSEDAARSLLPDGVYEYCCKNKLYREFDK